jgi:hypothetical protein
MRKTEQNYMGTNSGCCILLIACVLCAIARSYHVHYNVSCPIMMSTTRIHLATMRNTLPCTVHRRASLTFVNLELPGRIPVGVGSRSLQNEFGMLSYWTLLEHLEAYQLGVGINFSFICAYTRNDVTILPLKTLNNHPLSMGIR